MTVVEDSELFPGLITGKGQKSINKKTAVRKTRKPSLSLLSQVDAAEIQKVYDYWKEVHEKKKAKLDDNRRAYIARGILEYGTEACMEAIRGCSLSDWHMGTNPGNKVYNSLELILRDAEHVERFREYVNE